MRTMITAHSGCERTAPNSLAYIRKALTSEADALELDVRSRDGVLYCSHDKNGQGPSLAEAFALLQPEMMGIHCDLKEEGLEQAVRALADTYGLTERLYFSGEVSLEALQNDERLRRRTFWNLENVLPEAAEALRKLYRDGGTLDPGLWAEALHRCRAHDVNIINIYYPLFTEENGRILRDYGLSLSLWTVDEAADLRRFLRMGAYNITTMKPNLASVMRREVNSLS